ncbi:hypothetical protein OS493_037121 [Desmophyllum pertusum]|uniref:Uncharacterized protein n=1 Tax=Desmophyllum pertusum TaxID=174260 RepID=A0A9W9YAB1_9CNID|nr:hypothetical protein OS493_037121 [Desmophyllum pertusum]
MKEIYMYVKLKLTFIMKILLLVVLIGIVCLTPVVEILQQRSYLQTNNQEPEENSGELKKEIVLAICRALMLVNQMQGSLNDFEEVLILLKTCFVVVTKVSQLTGQRIGERLKSFLRNMVIRNQKSSPSALMQVTLVIGM